MRWSSIGPTCEGAFWSCTGKQLAFIAGHKHRRPDLAATFGKISKDIVAVWPFAARAQQPAMPVIGFLRPTKAEESGHLVAALRQGLRESGYQGDEVEIEARWGNGREEPLPKLAAELVSLHVAVIVAGSLPATTAAKSATANIPIVFVTGADPQTEGIVSSLSRPGGNITGVSFYDIPVTGKRLALLRELIPKAETIAVLQDPNFATFQSETRNWLGSLLSTRFRRAMCSAGSSMPAA